MIGRMPKLVLALLVGTLALAACERAAPADEPEADAMEEARAGWSAELRTAIDRGNTAFREGRYDAAVAAFRQATEEAPDVAAGWFGLHMAESALGNQAAADSALTRAESLTPGLGFGHPRSPMDGDGDLPEGHPPLQMPEGHPQD